VEHFLDNPVFYAMLSGNASQALGSAQVKYFDVEVSPFAGFAEAYADGFNELHQMLPGGRTILNAGRNEIEIPKGWTLKHHVPGTQFLYRSKENFDPAALDVTPLTKDDVEQMVSLATLTKPGPFASRTIEFGNYHGIFVNDQLAAMAGRRLHVYDFIEISAVCTHPHFLGKGFAGRLLKHQVNSILEEKKTPFLHVRSDNKRAIDLYEKLGFVKNGVMHFYFLKKE